MSLHHLGCLARENTYVHFVRELSRSFKRFILCRQRALPFGSKPFLCRKKFAPWGRKSHENIKGRGKQLSSPGRRPSIKGCLAPTHTARLNLSLERYHNNYTKDPAFQKKYSPRETQRRLRRDANYLSLYNSTRILSEITALWSNLVTREGRQELTDTRNLTTVTDREAFPHIY